MAESYSVEAILSAVDKGFTDSMRKADESMGGLDNNTQKTNTSIMDIAKGVGVFKLVDSAVGMVTGSLDGAIDRFDTLNKYPTVMKALGYSTEEVDKSMNKLTEGIDGLPTRLDEIVANTQQFAIATGDLDKGTDTAIALNNAMLASGASTADASRGMEQYRQMLGRGEVDMQSWRSVVDTMPIAMDKVAKSFREDGVESTNELYDALKDGNITFDEFNERLIELNDGVGGFADLAQKNSKGIKTSFANMKSAVVKGLEQTIRAIDEGLSNAGLGRITDILDNIKDGINDAFKVINALIPPFIASLMTLYNIIEPFLPLIMSIVAVIGTYQSVMGAARIATDLMKTSQAMLNAVMNANPIGILVTAIIVLVGAIIYLWNTNEDFRNAVTIIWEGIKLVISTSIEIIKTVIETTINIIKDIWDNVWGVVKTITEVTWEVIKTIVELQMTYISTVISVTLEIIKAIWEGAWNTVKTIAETIWNAIKITVETVINIIRGIVQTVTALITGDWEGVWEGMQNIVSSAWDGITSLVENGLQGAVDIITGWGDAFFDAGANIVNMIGDGIMSAVDAVTGAISNVTQGIRNFLPFSPAKEGPLKDLHRLNFGGTIATGIYAGAKEIDKAMNDVMDIPILDDFNANFNGSNASYSNELTLRESNRPMQLNLRLGNQNFKAFVDDVSELMSENTILELQT